MTDDKSSNPGPTLRRSKRLKSRKARAREREERAKRQREVAKLRFVQGWAMTDIAQSLEVSERTVERDILAIRKRLRGSAEKNLEHEVRDIVELLKMSFDAKRKYLWNEFIRLTMLRKDDDTHAARMDMISEITEIENSFCEQMRKLGIAKDSPRGESGNFNSLNIFNLLGGAYAGQPRDEIRSALRKRLDVIFSADGGSADSL